MFIAAGTATVFSALQTAEVLPTLTAYAGKKFEFEKKYACGVCRAVLDGEPCEKFDSCHLIHAQSVRPSCEDAGFCAVPAPYDADAAPLPNAAAFPDIRVTPVFGTKDYNQVRISAITSAERPATWDTAKSAEIFDYNEVFRYKWTKNKLHTKLIRVTPGNDTYAIGNVSVPITLPAQGDGVSGVIFADPCVKGASITADVACTYASKFKTLTRTPALLNVLAPATDFWGILGDNFYDKTGKVTGVMFDKISFEAKSKLMVTVPGNHDYWVLGGPDAGTKSDQYANGHMQWYAQDAKSAQHVGTGNKSAPFDFSSDPSTHHPLRGGNLPAITNAFHYHQIGNLGVVGYSGAYTLGETKPYMKEACAWLGAQQGMDVAMIVGHWDTDGLGCDKTMAGPMFYEEMKVLPGCDALDKKNMLKFFMGHTHCNIPHPHGKVDTGFMVAGQGMGGCGNYGMPILDTTGGRIKVYHFGIVDKDGTDHYDDTMKCLESKGWRACTDLAELWLDQALPARN